MLPDGQSGHDTHNSVAVGSNFPARHTSSDTQRRFAGGDQTTRQGQSCSDPHDAAALPGLDHPDGHFPRDTQSSIAVGV